MILAQRTQTIKPSPTLTIAARARQLQSEGRDLINLSIGEPDFDTPEHIKNAAITALKNGFTKYTPVDGIPGLKQAIVNKFSNDNQLNYATNQVMVTSGCKQALYNVFQALINPGDEVLIPAPYWVSYPDIVYLAEGKPVYINGTFSQRFKITADQLSAAITKKTKALILNSPSNPTGINYSEQELQAIAEVLLKHPEIYIISDDIYEHIIWSKNPFRNIVNICPELKERTIICHGVSKTYAMTGWRIGFAAGPKEIISAMTTMQSQSTSNPNSIAQVAAQAALEGDQHCVKIMADAYHARHDLVYQQLQRLPGVKCHLADGTFYSFFDISEAMQQLGNFASDVDFAEFLLNDAGVVVIPGSAFGSPGCLRLSYATSEQQLNEAMLRLQRVFNKE